jgi:hypothetical protein
MTRRVVRLLDRKPAKKIGPQPGERRPPKWRAMLQPLPVVPPSLILPKGLNPGCLSVFGKQLGMRFVWRRIGDEWHVWRIA